MPEGVGYPKGHPKHDPEAVNEDDTTQTVGQEVQATEAAAGEAPNVTPEEQAEYEDFVDQGFKVIYSGDAFEKIVDRIAAEQDPVQGLAQVTAAVASRVLSSAKGAGKEISGDAAFHGGIQLLEDLGENLTKAGVHNYTDKDLERASYLAMDAFREMNQDSGLINQEAVAEDMSLLQQGDASGELAGMMKKLGAPEHLQGAPVERPQNAPNVDRTPADAAVRDARQEIRGFSNGQ